MTFSKGFGLMHNKTRLNEAVEKNRYGEILFTLFFDHPDGHTLKLSFNKTKNRLLLTGKNGVIPVHDIMRASSVKTLHPKEQVSFLLDEVTKANPKIDKDFLAVVNKVTKMSWKISE